MSNNEKDILNIIKYFPSIFILLVSVILTLYLYDQNKNDLTDETQKLEES